MDSCVYERIVSVLSDAIEPRRISALPEVMGSEKDGRRKAWDAWNDDASKIVHSNLQLAVTQVMFLITIEKTACSADEEEKNAQVTGAGHGTATTAKEKQQASSEEETK
jgi:hypothetical protein